MPSGIFFPPLPDGSGTEVDEWRQVDGQLGCQAKQMDSCTTVAPRWVGIQRFDDGGDDGAFRGQGTSTKN